MDFQRYKTDNKLAMDTILRNPTNRIPTGLVHIMQHDHIERLARVGPGEYKKNPDEVYIKFLKNIGVDIVDQYLAINPLTMGDHGYEDIQFGTNTGSDDVLYDGMMIDSPESVVEHLEYIEFPRLQKSILNFNEELRIKEILDYEWKMQQMLGPEILKTGFDYLGFPILNYYAYGYINYFMAYALFPDVMEKHFKLQADYWLLNNKAAVIACKKAGLPPLYRLDHDIADSRGTLVNIKSLDRIWLPYFARCLEPVLKTDMQLIWHCDGNLMQMVPRLLEVGIKGFQGFQYEDGMDYIKICKMKTRDGGDLIIEAGVSVTRTLPFGTTEDVVDEMKFLVENGPPTGLFLAASSSVAPGVPWENIETMVEGFKYYKTNAIR